VSSPELEPAELAARLARKAQEDEIAVSEFAANSRIGDGVIGFHAQQAIEKWLKAVIASRGGKYDRTHDLDRLIETLTASGVQMPLDTDRLIAFTEYAVPLRYEDLLDAEPLDRDAAVTLVAEVGRWAGKAIADAGDAQSRRPDLNR
jgi:HEPN domain-containing protein